MTRAHVHSGGRWNNNIGGPVQGGFPAKRAWLRQFRFNVAFENEALPGYTTEKIDAMLAGCIPVYWGNPDVAHTSTRPASSISPGSSDDVAIEHLLALQHDEAQLHAMLREPWFPNNQPTPCYDPNASSISSNASPPTPEHPSHSGGRGCIRAAGPS